MKIAFKIIGVVIVIVLGMYAMSVMGIAFQALFQPITVAEKSSAMSKGIVNEVLTAENALTEYHWFKQQYADIQALEKKIERANQDFDAFMATLPADKEKWTRQDREEIQRLRTIATGIANMYDSAIADYDAKASMSDKAIFKDDLPADIFSGVKSGFELLGGR